MTIKQCLMALALGFTLPSYAGNNLELSALGKQLYRQGIGASGQVIKAYAQGDIELDGTQATCNSCHRRSGLGSSEGRTQTLPVAGDLLYQPRTKGRSTARGRDYAQGSVTVPGARPAYTDETLKIAIVNGIDAAGHRLNPIMPRFVLSDHEMEALISYLKSLSSNAAPGVDDETMHFATVITDDVSDSEAQAMLDVLTVYFKEKNSSTRHDVRRAKFAPWHRDWKYKAYRKWQLHIWRLKGAADTWPAQLEAYYQKQPVFALLSGISHVSWQPVHEFCERREIPALFPNTDLPVISDHDYYTVYFSKGPELDASAVFMQLTSHQAGKGQKLLQVFRNNEFGRAFAKASQKLALQAGFSIAEQVVPVDQPINKDGWEKLTNKAMPETVLLWLNDKDLQSLAFLTDAPPGKQFYISATLAPGFKQSLPAALQTATTIEDRFVAPDKMQSHLLRSNIWLQKKKLSRPGFTRIQANTFFTVTELTRVIMHLRDKYSRDYLLELLEHGTEKSLVTAMYPRLTLGPGQRYAAKGAYVYPFTAKTKDIPANWYVPD